MTDSMTTKWIRQFNEEAVHDEERNGQQSLVAVDLLNPRKDRSFHFSTILYEDNCARTPATKTKASRENNRLKEGLDDNPIQLQNVLRRGSGTHNVGNPHSNRKSSRIELCYSVPIVIETSPLKSFGILYPKALDNGYVSRSLGYPAGPDGLIRKALIKSAPFFDSFVLRVRKF
ncbi:hypothetical protein Trydic_g20614 [Trypoxylus dichotomus]